jgi:Domain of Unknown Function (DUF1080)
MQSVTTRIKRYGRDGLFGARILTRPVGLTCLFLTAMTTAAVGQQKAEDGWVQLFNGSDLTGWKTYPDSKAKWEVVDGTLVGSGPSGHLFSERGNYTNFHFRIEAKINDKGNSGQYFRATYTRGFPPGYEAQINATSGDPIRTGSLYPDNGASDGERKLMIVRDQLVKPDEWFAQDVIAVGNHIVIKLNGRTTVDFVDHRRLHASGHFAFQQHNDGSVITIRRAEVKELP